MVDIAPKWLEFIIRAISLIMNLSLIAGILAFTKTRLSAKRVLIINYVALMILVVGLCIGIAILDVFAND